MVDELSGDENVAFVAKNSPLFTEQTPESQHDCIVQLTSVHGCNWEQFIAEHVGILQAGTLQPASEQLFERHISICSCEDSAGGSTGLLVAMDESNIVRDNGDERIGELGVTSGD